MEFLVQTLDDLEDLFYAAALKAERIRQGIELVLFVAVSLAIQIAGVQLALQAPPLALAVVALLMVGALYRAAVRYAPRVPFES